MLGTGFGIPPAVQPWPPFAAEDASPELAAVERAIAANVKTALKGLRDAPLSRLADIYSEEADVFFTFKELDHYAGRDAGDYWGATQQDAGVEPRWPDMPGRRVFAYLKPCRPLPQLLTSLLDSGHPTLILSRQGR